MKQLLIIDSNFVKNECFLSNEHLLIVHGIKNFI